jgi:hypothetical protein
LIIIEISSSSPTAVGVMSIPDGHLVQMPFVTWSGTPAPRLIGILLPKLVAPLTNGLIGHRDPTRKEQLFNITITEAK